MRTIGGSAALLFAFAALVQLNDPDPWLWTLLYLSAALLGMAVALGRPSTLFAGAVGGAFAVMLGLWLPALPHARLDAFRSARMHDASEVGAERAAQEEEVRELLGLAIGLLFAGAAFVHARRGQTPPR